MFYPIAVVPAVDSFTSAFLCVYVCLVLHKTSTLRLVFFLSLWELKMWAQVESDVFSVTRTSECEEKRV